MEVIFIISAVIIARLLPMTYGIVMFQEHCIVYDVVWHCILMIVMNSVHSRRVVTEIFNGYLMRYLYIVQFISLL